MSEVLTAVTQVGVLAFVVASMAAMGLGLTVDRIIGPLRQVRTVALVLGANFVAVPVVAIAAARLLPVEEATGTALVIYGCCAGAPFLPKLAQMAKADVAMAVGTMVLLMVITVGYAPLVLPLAVQGVQVDAGQIAASLVVFMLVPLGVGLAVRARYPQVAETVVGPIGRASSAALLVGISAGVFVSWQDIIGSIGSWVFVGTAVLIIAALGAGYLAGAGRPGQIRRVTTLGTAQRNISAALVVAGSLSGEVVVLTLVAGLALLLALLVTAGELGRRTSTAPTTTP